MPYDWTNEPQKKVAEVIRKGTVESWGTDGTAVYSYPYKMFTKTTGNGVTEFLPLNKIVRIKHTPTLEEKAGAGDVSFFPYYSVYNKKVKNKRKEDPYNNIFKKYKQFIVENESLFFTDDGQPKPLEPEVEEMLNEAMNLSEEEVFTRRTRK